MTEIPLTVRRANTNFSQVDTAAGRGETNIITKIGMPIAKITPQPAERTKDPAWQSAFAALKSALAALKKSLRPNPVTGYRRCRSILGLWFSRENLSRPDGENGINAVFVDTHSI